jgi:hypothetical protein
VGVVTDGDESPKKRFSENVATVSYALLISRDMIVTAIFALNAFGCLIIAVMTAPRRLASLRLQQQRGRE